MMEVDNDSVQLPSKLFLVAERLWHGRNGPSTAGPVDHFELLDGIDDDDEGRLNTFDFSTTYF